METNWAVPIKHGAAIRALKVIADSIKNPTYAEIMEVIAHMQDLAKEYCVFRNIDIE